MTIHSISNKGWVVIPTELRKKYHLKPGSEVHIVDYGGVLAIIPVMQDPIRQAAGMLKTEKELTKILLEEHQRER
ncbi:MAG: AbrB/MazE/SpoVT family DNA-binding domain-containing protein [Anaerolineales bacterium]